MKKVLSFLLVFAMVFSMCGTVFAASSNTLTFHLTSDDEYEQTVPTGTIITVSFTVENDSGEDITLKRLQNEIYYDHEFFEFVDASATVVKPNAGLGSALQIYSTNEHRVYVNSIMPAAYSAKELVATFQLRVLEDEIGAWSIIETKAQKATDTEGEITGITEKNLKIIIGDPDPSAKKYTITYVDGSTQLYKDEVISGNTTSLRSAPEKTGYKFTGWKIDGAIKEAGSSYTVTKNVTATAQWTIRDKFVLSFDTNGGSSVTAVSAYDGETITLTQTSTRSGYTFNGWYSDSALKTKVLEVTLTKNTTVYAKWTQNSTGGGGGGGGGGGSTQNFTITFKTTDDVTLGTVQKPANTTVNLSQHTYAKDGYTFEGWYTEKELQNKLTSIELTEDVTLYANWIRSVPGTSSPAGHHPSSLITEHVSYIVGREGGRIAPQENITRAEVATIFFRLLTEEIRDANYTKVNVFTDANSGNWFNTAVSTLAKLEIVKGRTPETFEPNEFITRAEFTTIAARFSDAVWEGEDLFSDIAGHWAQDYINAAASIGWIVGENGRFRPDDNITRAEVMTLVNRMLERQPESKDDLLEGMTQWVDNADENAWYYLAVQEATNSHDYEMKADGVHEKWTKLTENPDWAALEK